MNISQAQPSATRESAATEVVLISNGFQTNYERGFSNGLAAWHSSVTLIGSDRTDVSGLARGVRMLNLRGNQDERRSRLAKIVNLLRYLGRLLAFAATHRDATFHVIGLVEPPLLYGVGVGSCLRIVGARYVLTVHNLLPHNRHTRLNRRLFQWAFHIPHHLVCHTALMKTRLVDEFGIPAGRITIMEHGIEPPQPMPAKRVSADALKLLFFGSISEYKGLDLLLEALRGVTCAFRLTIRGRAGSARYAAYICGLIAEHPAASRIDWQPGFVAESDVPKLFAQADAIVLPYRAIDQSGVLFQALRHGVPVVATDVGSLSAYVTPQVGVVCAPDAGALARAIDRLAQRVDTLDSAEIQGIGRQFDWAVTTGVLREAYVAR